MPHPRRRGVQRAFCAAAEFTYFDEDARTGDALRPAAHQRHARAGGATRAAAHAGTADAGSINKTEAARPERDADAQPASESSRRWRPHLHLARCVHLHERHPLVGQLRRVALLRGGLFDDHTGGGGDSVLRQQCVTLQRAALSRQRGARLGSDHLPHRGDERDDHRADADHC